MNIEEQRMVAEPVEGLEEILLDNSKLDRTTRIITLEHSRLFLKKTRMYLPRAMKTCPGSTLQL